MIPAARARESRIALSRVEGEGASCPGRFKTRCCPCGAACIEDLRTKGKFRAEARFRKCRGGCMYECTGPHENAVARAKTCSCGTPADWHKGTCAWTRSPMPCSSRSQRSPVDFDSLATHEPSSSTAWRHSVVKKRTNHLQKPAPIKEEPQDIANRARAGNVANPLRVLDQPLRFT